MARRTKGRKVNGILLLDKSVGMSSNQALQKARYLLQAQKAGHTGSLDPIATGLLPLCFGEATKLSQYLLESRKSYRAGIRLGEMTTTGDAEGEVVEQNPVQVTRSQIEQALANFSGDIQQVPPMYSALKHQGQPLYKLARQGIEVERQPRNVTVYRLELASQANDFIELGIQCSSGFYVRSLAHDLGQALGCGAHVVSLRRTGVAGFDISAAVTLDQLEEMSLEQRDAQLIRCDKGITFMPEVKLSTDAAFYLLQGQPVKAMNMPDQGLVRLYGPDQEFMGVGKILDDGRVAPKRLVFSRVQ